MHAKKTVTSLPGLDQRPWLHPGRKPHSFSEKERFSGLSEGGKVVSFWLFFVALLLKPVSRALGVCHHATQRDGEAEEQQETVGGAPLPRQCIQCGPPR